MRNPRGWAPHHDPWRAPTHHRAGPITGATRAGPATRPAAATALPAGYLLLLAVGTYRSTLNATVALSAGSHELRILITREFAPDLTMTQWVDNVTLVSETGEQLADLRTMVSGVGPGTSLADKVSNAQAAYNSGDVAGACSILNAFTNQVGAQSGKSILPGTAASLIADAAQIETALGC